MECSGEPSIDWQRRWLIRRLIKFNKSTLDKLPYPDWYIQNPTQCNTTRRPVLPSSTPETYIYDPDFECDPYYNDTLYDTTNLVFRQSINVPFHEFIAKTNMDISTTPKRKDDLNHTPEPQAEEEHDTEITVIVTPPTTSLKSILKHNNQSPPVDYESPKKLPATSNEIQAAMTSSPSSPQSPENKYSTHESLVSNEEAGDPTEAVMPTTKPRTRRVKQTLTCEFNQKAKTNRAIDSSPTSIQTPNIETLNPEQDEDWIHTNKQLNKIVITDLDTSEKCIPIFSAINLKKKRKMLFAPMDFNNLSVDALESEYQKIKSVSPDNILKEMDPPTFKVQVANGDIGTPTITVQLHFELGDWTFKETFIVATKMTGPILGLLFLKNNSAILDVS